MVNISSINSLSSMVNISITQSLQHGLHISPLYTVSPAWSISPEFIVSLKVPVSLASAVCLLYSTLYSLLGSMPIISDITRLSSFGPSEVSGMAYNLLLLHDLHLCHALLIQLIQHARLTTQNPTLEFPAFLYVIL
jgi:hypothetical protein